jgi:F0F1-type ATP synthase membrane subunit b/b'
MLTLLAAGGGGLLDTLGVSPPVVLVQIAIFVTTFIVLKDGLFGRVLRRMQAREAEIHESQKRIEKDRTELKARLKEYEEQIAKIDRAAYDMAQAAVKDALAAAAAMVADAQNRAKKDVEEALAIVSSEKRAAREKLREDVTRLTLEVVEKVLETKLDPSTHGAAVRSFVAERSAR